jgi:hypothetical protein
LFGGIELLHLAARIEVALETLRKVGDRPPDDRRCRATATIVELVSRAGL